MKKRICIAALLAAASASVPAADFGLGLTVESGSAIYFPIRFDDRFVLEPYYEAQRGATRVPSSSWETGPKSSSNSWLTKATRSPR